MNKEQNWLPLAEYSMKHKISVSTLRRRIKSEDIKYRFDDGKYLILDIEENSIIKNSMDNLPIEDKNNHSAEHRPSLKSEAYPGVVFSSKTDHQNHKDTKDESVITAANRLLSDLKTAYTQVLQEKEEQIMSLKEEITDLKTLIKVLESENSRLRNIEIEGYAQSIGFVEN